MTELRKPSLDPWWTNRLSEKMEENFPDIIGFGALVDCWKMDGWNDGTTTLFGVYCFEGKYILCTFPDYGEPTRNLVKPKSEHTGWCKA